MTLKEVLKKYNVSTEYLKTRLNIPVSIAESERIAWLRKQFDFKMKEVEIIINDYKEKDE
jgi:hypothetical protein